MTESVIQPELLYRDFCITDIIVLEIDSNTSSMPLSLIIVSAFEFE